jgi:tRNA G18 (ribose-2'-O)-methylase SpoU
VRALQAEGFCCIALALDPSARSLDDQALRAHDRIALFLGSEGAGLRHETVAACDERAIIPMSHGVDSLNVATAAAIAFWELVRR